MVTPKSHIVLLLLVSLLTGSIFPLLKIAELTLPPLTLTMLRAVLATLVMLLVVGLGMRRSLVPLLAHWKTFAVMGFLGAGKLAGFRAPRKMEPEICPQSQSIAECAAWRNVRKVLLFMDTAEVRNR